MSGIVADWMRIITDIRVGQDTITLSFGEETETYPVNSYVSVIRDFCFYSFPIKDLVVGDKLVEVYQEVTA